MDKQRLKRPKHNPLKQCISDQQENPNMSLHFKFSIIIRNPKKKMFIVHTLIIPSLLLYDFWMTMLLHVSIPLFLCSFLIVLLCQFYFTFPFLFCTLCKFKQAYNLGGQLYISAKFQLFSFTWDLFIDFIVIWNGIKISKFRSFIRH